MPMANSRMPDDWIARALQSAPFAKIAEGYRTCVGRAAFEYVNKPNDKDNKGNPRAEPQYELSLLLPPGGAEQMNTVLWPDVYNIMKGKWPAQFRADGVPFGLKMPWRDQGERVARKTGVLHNGMNPGNPILRFVSKYRPQVYDANMNLITDDKRLYAGCWCIVLTSPYTYDNEQRGVGLGLNGIMVIADDDNLSGGGPDVKSAFGGVQVEARFDAAAAFGTAPGAPGGPPPMPGASFMPAPQPVGAPPPGIPGVAYTAPPPGYGVPAAPAAPAGGFDLAAMLS